MVEHQADGVHVARELRYPAVPGSMPLGRDLWRPAGQRISSTAGSRPSSSAGCAAALASAPRPSSNSMLAASPAVAASISGDDSAAGCALGFGFAPRSSRSLTDGGIAGTASRDHQRRSHVTGTRIDVRAVVQQETCLLQVRRRPHQGRRVGVIVACWDRRLVSIAVPSVAAPV